MAGLKLIESHLPLPLSVGIKGVTHPSHPGRASVVSEDEEICHFSHGNIMFHVWGDGEILALKENGLSSNVWVDFCSRS